MKKPIPNSICDDCLNSECVWRAPSWGIDPPAMDCPEKKTPPATNYDRIIRKTPEDLAEFILKIKGHCKAATFGPFECPYTENFTTDCVKCWLDWLKEAAE